MKRLCGAHSPGKYKCRKLYCPYFYYDGTKHYCSFDKRAWNYIHPDKERYPSFIVKFLMQLYFLVRRFDTVLILLIGKIFNKYWNGEKWAIYIKE